MLLDGRNRKYGDHCALVQPGKIPDGIVGPEPVLQRHVLPPATEDRAGAARAKLTRQHWIWSMPQHCGDPAWNPAT